MVRNPNQTDDVRSNRREGEEKDDESQCINEYNDDPDTSDSHTLVSLSLGRKLSSVHQFLLLTLTPIFIQGNMGRITWVVNGFTAVRCLRP